MQRQLSLCGKQYTYLENSSLPFDPLRVDLDSQRRDKRPRLKVLLRGELAESFKSSGLHVNNNDS